MTNLLRSHLIILFFSFSLEHWIWQLRLHTDQWWDSLLRSLPNPFPRCRTCREASLVDRRQLQPTAWIPTSSGTSGSIMGASSCLAASRTGEVESLFSHSFMKAVSVEVSKKVLFSSLILVWCFIRSSWVLSSSYIQNIKNPTVNILHLFSFFLSLFLKSNVNFISSQKQKLCSQLMTLPQTLWWKCDIAKEERKK